MARSARREWRLTDAAPARCSRSSTTDCKTKSASSACGSTIRKMSTPRSRNSSANVALKPDLIFQLALVNHISDLEAHIELEGLRHLRKEAQIAALLIHQRLIVE